jgi:minor extracellular protease Epr
MRTTAILLLGLAALPIMAASAQVLAPVGQTLGNVRGVVDDVAGPVVDRAGGLVGDVQRLAADRVSRLTGLVRSNRQTLELDDRGDPSVRGEILGVDIDPAAIAAAQGAGFRVVEESEIEGLGIRSVRLAVPEGMTLARALKAIRKAAPGSWSANQLHFESGATPAASGPPLPSRPATGARIGMIDGGVGQHPALSGPIEQRGFARGAPAASAHGTAIASLIAGQNGFRGVLPGTPLLAADVYGADPAGGNALAIARALGWMAGREVRVVTVSLVGPANPLLAKVIAGARTRGMMIVAAVGNDGPAAPPAYPASYPGVIAVTGVDGRNRALIEAGRALHLDYAAPGADMLGAKPGGGTVKLRGTSYAAPLVAARLAAGTIATLDREAVDLGKRGPDKLYGRGLVCGDCRTKP